MMSGSEVLTRLVDSLAWPLFAVWVIWYLRAPVTKVLERMTRLKGGPVEAEFAAELNRVKEEAARVELPPASEVKEPVESAEEKYRSLSEIAPSAAIIEGWREIELAVASVFPTQKGFRTPLELKRLLQQSQILDAASVQLLEDLRQLRNKSVHTDEVHLTVEQSYDYAILASRLAAKIRESQAGLSRECSS